MDDKTISPPPLSAQSSARLLSVDNAKVHFSLLRGDKIITVQAVRGISFELQAGSILGIVGESGSGKSVTTSLITGLLPPNASASGTVIFKGTDITQLAFESGILAPLEQRTNGSQSRKSKKTSFEQLRQIRGKKIGMIFQEPGRSFDPLQNIGSVFFETFRSSNSSITKEESDKKASSLLEETGLSDAKTRLSNFPHQFSGGQLQRIGIALALAQGCELLIADEPTTALDVTIQAQIAQLLRTLRKTRGISIIFISHNIDLVASQADNIMVIYGGLVMESGHADIIMKKPLHPYTQALLDAAPSFGSHYSKSPLNAIPGRVADPSRPESGCPFAPRCAYAAPPCTASVPAYKAVHLDLDIRAESTESDVRTGSANQAVRAGSAADTVCPAAGSSAPHFVRCIRISAEGALS